VTATGSHLQPGSEVVAIAAHHRAPEVSAVGFNRSRTKAAALADRDRRLTIIKAELSKPVAIPDRDTLHAALLRRVADWRDVLRGPHVQPARVVLQHLMDLPLLVCDRPVPDYILKRLEQAPNGPHWIAAAKPEGLTIGLVWWRPQRERRACTISPWRAKHRSSA
jgi:hypothetical protein